MNSIIWGIQRCMIWITIITLGRGLHWRFPPNISTNFLKCERFREYNFSHIFDFDFWSACWCISWEIYIHIVSQLEVSARGRTFYYNSSHGVQLCLGLSDSTQTQPRLSGDCPTIRQLSCTTSHSHYQLQPVFGKRFYVELFPDTPDYVFSNFKGRQSAGIILFLVGEWTNMSHFILEGFYICVFIKSIKTKWQQLKNWAHSPHHTQHSWTTGDRTRYVRVETAGI